MAACCAYLGQQRGPLSSLPTESSSLQRGCVLTKKSIARDTSSPEIASEQEAASSKRRNDIATVRRLMSSIWGIEALSDFHGIYLTTFQYRGAFKID